ncbi:uncharacterized protein A4U43_C06F200 [Asparagus officinalis]|uniref:Uncharacterized protein n=1 Tax=Asparagus officinalis TaxID=4686 RepID=A0A5P1EIK0_ASPOF|nr:uncharacterized protein A4U43_C06F200 [Asparagus officinalis]
MERSVRSFWAVLLLSALLVVDARPTATQGSTPEGHEHGAAMPEFRIRSDPEVQLPEEDVRAWEHGQARPALDLAQFRVTYFLFVKF